MPRLCRVVVTVYAVLCALALVIIPLNAAGMFGMEPDPLSAIYALLLSAPWSFLAGDLVGDSVVGHLILAVVGMAVNAVIFLFVCRLFGRRAS